MHLGSLESTQEARVALGYRLVQLLRIFRALQTSRVHTESFICDFLFVSVEILKCKISIYQITGVSLFLNFVSFFSVSLQQQIARDAHMLVSTYSITRNTCIAEPREARRGAHKGWEDRREMKEIM